MIKYSLPPVHKITHTYTHTTSLSAECNQSSCWDQSGSRYLICPIIDSWREPPESPGKETAEVSQAVGTSYFQSLGCLKPGQVKGEENRIMDVGMKTREFREDGKYVVEGQHTDENMLTKLWNTII